MKVVSTYIVPPHELQRTLKNLFFSDFFLGISLERLRYLAQPSYNCVTLYFAEFVTLLGGTCTMADLAQFLLPTVLPLFTFQVLTYQLWFLMSQVLSRTLRRDTGR